MPWKWRSRQKSNHPLVTVDTRPSLFDPQRPFVNTDTTVVTPPIFAYALLNVRSSRD